jgi:hypothetical protein
MSLGSQGKEPASCDMEKKKMKKNKETRLWRRKFEMPLGMTGSFGTKGNSMKKMEKTKKKSQRL